MTSIAEQHAANLAQRLTWRGVTPTDLDRLDALHADRHDRGTRAVAPGYTRNVSCAHCGRHNITPPCGSWDEADEYLDAIGWTGLDEHPLCPNCASGGEWL